jgi:hypothetical protein
MKQARTATPNRTPPAGLSAEQERAIPLLLEGKSQTDTAAEIGVPLEVLDGWLTRDAAFVAAWNRTRADEWNAAVQRLRQLAGKAVDALSSLLDSDAEATRLRAAGAVLKFVSLSGGRPLGPTTPDEVTRQWQEAEATRQRDEELWRVLNL